MKKLSEQNLYFSDFPPSQIISDVAHEIYTKTSTKFEEFGVYDSDTAIPLITLIIQELQYNGEL